MDMQDFMDKHTGRTPFADLTSLGPVSQRFARRVGDAELARALIANNFWRAFVESDAYLRALSRMGASINAAVSSRAIVVPRPDLNRFDLVVLDPGLQGNTSPQAMELGMRYFPPTDAVAGAMNASRSGVPDVIGQDALHLALETAYGGSDVFSVVLAPAPRREFLCVPSNILDVDDQQGELSTAGILVKCNKKPATVGVTAALHAVIAAASNVEVDGVSGTILRSDRLYDTAFIELPSAPSTGILQNQGVMKGMLPRGSQQCSFSGVGSQQTTSTSITGWDAQLPTPSEYRQALIYTKHDAQPGDSGAALVTSDDWVVGFAFERTMYGDNPAYCSWVWADSVLKALDVQPS
jgi:hypothetical protein